MSRDAEADKRYRQLCRDWDRIHASRWRPAETALSGAQGTELSPQAPDEKPPTPRSDGGW